LIKRQIKHSRLYLSILLLFLIGTSYSQSKRFHIENLSINDGLSQNEVTTICEDDYGFMWFGTRGGLNRFDGYKFKQYKPNREKSTSILNPSIERITKDKDGNILIGSKSGGFSIYNAKKEYFDHRSQSLDLPLNRVISFLDASDGYLWEGSFYNGLLHLNPETNEFEHHYKGERVSSIIETRDSTVWVSGTEQLRFKKKGEEFKIFDFDGSGNQITKLVEDKDSSIIWLVGWNLNLIKFSYKDFAYQSYTLPGDQKERKNTYSVIQDKNGKLWVGTWGNGLYLFDPKTEHFEKIQIDQGNKVVDYDIILDVFEDSRGIIWVGTDGGGIVRISPYMDFSVIYPAYKEHILHVNAFYSDITNNYLIGSRGKGLYQSEDLKEYKQVPIRASSNNQSWERNSIYCIRKMDNDQIWIGSDFGIYEMNNSGGSSTCIPLSERYNNADFIEVKKVLSIEENKDDLWIGTQQKGLYHFRKKDETYLFQNHFISDNTKEGILDNRVSSVFTDDEGNLWVGTYGGMMQFNPMDSSFISLSDLIEGDYSPVCNIVLCAMIDQESTIWYGTPCGLNKVVKMRDGRYKIKLYGKEEGLPDDYISNVKEDDNGNIWISTNLGISRINKEGEVHNYEESDGTGSFSFSENSAFQDHNGNICFGGSRGLTYFAPNEIEVEDETVALAFTGIKILNSDVPVNDEGILPTNVNDLDKLVLTYKEKEVSIAFASLDFKSPFLNQYAFKLDGAKGEDENWSYIGNKTSISLRNLLPGNYTLSIKGSNSFGAWSGETLDLNIWVKTPPWKSNLALLLYFVVILGIIYAIIHISMRQLKLENQARLEKINREQDKKLNEYKIQFFTDISHEFRTPLTLILAPINELMTKDLSGVSNEISDKIKIIGKNAGNLMRLVNQLLEFRKMNAGKLRLEVAKHNLTSFVLDVCESFNELAEHKEVRFKKDLIKEDLFLYFDEIKLWIMMNNLLSNAFKYCGDPGEIVVKLYENEDHAIIKVSNNGQGLTKKEIDQIFDRFYQKSKASLSSSGIGLNLVKGYTDLHKGIIEVESQRGSHTHFILKLQKGKKHFKAEEILENPGKRKLEKTLSFDSMNLEKKVQVSAGKTKGKKIVLVDDNNDLLDYLYSIFKDNYEIKTAKNGKEAFDVVLKFKPDLVISDVMMPVWDGYELCDRIKSHKKIWDIPVILLTAKTTTGSRFFGIKKGADIFIAKPFDPNYLLLKVKQILLNREALKNKYSKVVSLEPTQLELKPDSEKMINEAIKFIEDNMANPDLNSDLLAFHLAMSSSTLYRKLKNISELSPGEFIKEIRLKRAAQLLKESSLTVTEVADKIGYKDVSRFRENFKSVYKHTPNQFRK